MYYRNGIIIEAGWC